MENDYLTTAEAAAVLRMSARSVQQACADGRIPARRVFRKWLIHRDDLARLVGGSEPARLNVSEPAPGGSAAIVGGSGAGAANPPKLQPMQPMQPSAKPRGGRR